jgi:hypothetical protein
MRPFPTIEKSSCLGFEFITKKSKSFWCDNQSTIANQIHEHIHYFAQGVVHLDRFWLLLNHRNDFDDLLKITTKVSSDLGYIFLSRIRMNMYIHETEYIEFIQTIIEHNAKVLFATVYRQPDLFTGQPTLEMMREDLRTGLWIT